MVLGNKEMDDFGYAAWRHIGFENLLHVTDLKTGFFYRFATGALLWRIGIQQAGTGL
ncbi:hypothetical protein D3C87_2088820 [compost metagenome]